MFYMKRLWILLLISTLCPVSINACSLPAEPCAAIVPINSGGAGMEMITEGNTFFYLVPQGTTASFRTVWDPAAHNTGGGLQKDKYDWCTKAGIAFEPGADKPNGYGYFPASAMADFFEIQGKGNVVEAFTRTTGVSTEDAFIAGDLGPYLTLSTFAKPGQESEVSTIGGTATEYPDEGLFPLAGLSNEPVEPAIDSVFPNHLKSNSTVPITFEGSTINVYKVSDDKAIQIMNEGLLIEDIQIDLTDIEVSDYKAFVRSGNEACNVEVESAPQLPLSATGEDGAPGPDYSITFNIPTFNGDKEASKVKFKVWAPGAGFEITHIYWAWEEKVFNKDSETRVTTPAVYDASGTLVTPEVKTTKEVWKQEAGIKKCSEQLKLKVIKPAAEAGSTDFIVYDTKGPIAAKFTTNPTEQSFAETGQTTMPFVLEVLDTNPYFKEAFNTTIGSFNFNQSVDNLKLNIYYTYPCYQFSSEGGLSMDALKTGGYGLADLENLSNKTASFKSYKYEPKWVWKRANVTGLSISASTKKPGSTGRHAGSLNTIYGTVAIQQPRPWHQCNDSTSADGKSSPEPKFKLFAISNDSQGLPCMQYASVFGIGESLVSDTAKPDAGSDSEAFSPSDGSVIPVGELLDKIPSPGIPTSSWSNLAFMKAKDEIAPEIQVVVFDTRTNKYHMFGTKENVDATFSNFGSNGFDDDYSSGVLPYLGKKDAIDGEHKFTEISDLNGLFDTYLSGANAISTVADDTNVGYVCQKNNRLVFYIRAFDNINTCDASKKFGVSSIDYTIQDKDGTVSDSISTSDMMKAIEHVFRFENIDAGGAVSPEYSLTVNASDFNGNSREFKLAIAVMGRKLDIRTLEERRKRIDD
ncbi:MAG: hypothetical protein AB1403_07290 [Candidatus Riflebacteria bacterium]